MQKWIVCGWWLITLCACAPQTQHHVCTPSEYKCANSTYCCLIGWQCGSNHSALIDCGPGTCCKTFDLVVDLPPDNSTNVSSSTSFSAGWAGWIMGCIGVLFSSCLDV